MLTSLAPVSSPSCCSTPWNRTHVSRGKVNTGPAVGLQTNTHTYTTQGYLYSNILTVHFWPHWGQACGLSGANILMNIMLLLWLIFRYAVQFLWKPLFIIFQLIKSTQSKLMPHVTSLTVLKVKEKPLKGFLHLAAHLKFSLSAALTKIHLLNYLISWGLSGLVVLSLKCVTPYNQEKKTCKKLYWGPSSQCHLL